MKKITTTFFLLLALVFLLPTESKAAWSQLVFRSTIDANWNATTDANFKKLDNDGNEWQREIDASNVVGDIYFRIFVSDGSRQIYPSNNGEELTIDGNCNNPNFGSYDGQNAFKINRKNGCSKYILSAKYSKNSWVLTLKAKDQIRYKQGSAEYSYATITYNNGNGIGTANISMIDDKTYEFQISNSDGNWYGNNGTMTSSNNQDWGFDSNNNACKIQTSSKGTNIYSYSRVYTFKTDWTSGSLKVSATYQNVGDYYLIVPNENVGNTARAISENWVPKNHKAFKITGSRERNQTIPLLNPDLTSVTLKIDGQQLHYDNNKKIRFYIYDKANNKYYQPNTDTEITQMYFTSNERDGVGRSHDDIKNNATGKYYYIDEEHAKTNIDGTVYPTKSLTFMFSQYNAEKNFYNEDKINIDGHFTHGNSIYYVNEKNRVLGNAKLMVAFLKTRGVGSKYYTEHITKSANGNEAGVYLVGNMGVNGYQNGSESTYDKSQYKMVRNLWKDGKIQNNIKEAEADSIVYSCEIKRGNASWENFFLSFTTGDMLGENEKMWNPLLRPRVQNKMDAQALEGGIFYYLSDGGKGSDQAQSLNPLLTEDQQKRYVSYKVYFNATYSTYRIEFFDGFYIAGTAVHDKTGEDSEYLESANRIAMQEQTINKITHYEYTGTFTKGGEFAFFVNDKTYAHNYSEDDDDAAVNISYDKKWQTQAPVDNDGKATGKDYPYYNHVRYNTNGDNDNKSLGVTDGKKNNTIKWTLPTGEYTLRLYYGGIEGLKDATNHPKALYTIDKVVTLYNVTSNFAGTDHNYGGWYPFSDDCALWLPTGIKAYYVSEIKDGKAVLTEVDGNTIPANFGVLLHDGNLNEKNESNPIHLYPVAMDNSDENYTTESTNNNLLVNCAKHDPATKIQPITGEGENKKYNYFFTPDYYINGVRTEVPLNFWKTKTDATAVKNGTYLSVSTQVLPVAFDSTGNNYQYEADAVSVAMNARNYCFPLSFDGFDDTIITGIVSIDNDKEYNNSNAWYTIQGVKTSKPSVSGIYIHNGKKVIIK